MINRNGDKLLSFSVPADGAFNNRDFINGAINYSSLHTCLFIQEVLIKFVRKIANDISHDFTGSSLFIDDDII